MNKELEVVEPEEKGMMELFGKSVIERASSYAVEIKNIIDAQKLYTMIGTNKHVHVEGWTTLGALLRVFPDVVITERNDDGKTIRGYLVEVKKFDKYAKKDIISEKFIREALYNENQMKIIKTPDGEEIREIQEIKYKSRVELVTLTGQRFGGAFAICSNLEEGKLFQDESDIASMSETRATGKVFRLSFSWVMKLAGYNPTIPEEMKTFSNGKPEQKEEDKIDLTVQVKSPDESKKDKTVEAEKEKLNLPADQEDQKKLWIQLVTNGKMQGLITSKDIDAVLAQGGASKPPKISQLEKVIPLLWDMIEKRKEEVLDFIKSLA